MRSASRAEERTTATREAIRDAAIARFGRDGLDAGLRAIAADAGVSPALIVHHFGSKDGLRAACDAHVLAVVHAQKSAAVSQGGPGAMLAAMASLDEYVPVVAYCLQAVQAGGEIARLFLEQFIADAEEYIAEGVAAGTIKPSRDEKARATYLTLSGFSAILLDMRLHPPADPGDLGAIMRGYLARTGLPSLELFTQGFFTDHRMLDEYLMYVTDPPPPDRPDAPAP